MVTESAGITGKGNSAEERFCKITGAERLPGRSPLGDALFKKEQTEIYVEIKKVGIKEAGKGGTLNQIRAIKYLPLVVYIDEPMNERWYVVPPDEIVRMVSTKKRGQHGENPFENSSLTSTSLKKYEVSARDLSVATWSAWRQGQKNIKLKKDMESLRDELKLISNRYKTSVKKFRRI